MKAAWVRLASRFNALSARERGWVFAGALFVLFFGYFTLMLDPLLIRHKHASGRLAETRQAIKNTDAMIRAQETVTAPDTAKRNYAEALRRQLAGIDQSMQGLQRGLVPPERMAKVLEDMLARHRGLQVVALRTLPVQRFENPALPRETKPAEKGAKTAPPGDGAERSIYQHSFELTLQGSYADLHDYLSRLEQLPWQMYWGRLLLDADQHPRLRVTLLVHTLSLNKAWLVV